MHPTKNDLPQKTRAKVAAVLADRLADATDLMLQSKQAHWNVKGPSFIALHELFDKVAESLEDQIDTIAERITALGGRAHGTIASVARRSTLKPYPEDIAEGLAHVDALSASLADYAAKTRAAIETAARIGDADTADLFTGVSREADKYLWFLEAHLHAKR